MRLRPEEENSQRGGVTGAASGAIPESRFRQAQTINSVAVHTHSTKMPIKR